MSHVDCSRVLFEVLWFHVVFVSCGFCVFVAFRCLSHSVHQGRFLPPGLTDTWPTWGPPTRFSPCSAHSAPPLVLGAAQAVVGFISRPHSSASSSFPQQD